jgi:effector-binding domain-containing protein
MINFKQLLFMSVFFVSSVLQAQDISEKTAQKVANNFLKLKIKDPLKKLSKQLNLVNITSTIDKKYNGFYVFTVENGNGFCIVSSESANHPILAYSTNSSLSNIKKNSPEFLNILNNYQDVSQKLRKNVLKKSYSKDSELIKKEWEALISDNELYISQNLTKRISNGSSLPESVAPLIKTEWDQSPFYNKYTPVTYDGKPTFTGSAATAMAQIMKYWNYPTTGSDSVSYRIPKTYFYYSYDWRWKKLSANFQKTTYHWNKMPIALSNSSSEDQIDAVATLMLHAGISVNMMYGPMGSGAHSDHVPNALKKYFKYSSDIELKERSDYNSDEEWLNVIKGQISKGYPVYFSSISPDAEHAYIADGYDSNNYIHLNLGWAGEANGYYYINDLRGYSSSQLIVINIYPSEYNCQPPTGLSTSDITSNAVTFTWNNDITSKSYKIQYKENGDKDWTIAAEKTTGSYFILSNLSANTTYTARVIANCDTIDSKSNNFAEISFQTKADKIHTIGSCINNFEPNNSFDDAHLITTDSTYYAGIGSSNDVDYYKFVITKNSNLIITLNNFFKDYDIKLYNWYKEEIGQSIAGNNTREKIKVENILPGTYYLKVYGYEGAFDESQCYELSILTSPTTPLCSNNYEPNDSFEEAYPIDVFTTYYAGIGSSRDKDYYKFSLDTDSDVNIILQNIYYGYDFNLYDSSKNLVEKGLSDEHNNKIIHAKNLASGTYYIEITGRFYPFQCYSLLVDINVSRNSCINNYEPNESFNNAIEIKTNNVYSAGIKVPNDLDYYKFTLDNKSNVTVTLQNIADKYELKLFNSSQTEIGSSYNEDKSDEIININDLEPGTYYILVQGIDGAYNVTQCYGLLVETTSSVSPCINNYESNDSIQDAISIDINTKYEAGIGSSTDKDYYKFTINETSDITILLENLPKNYDLKLYDDLGYEIDHSTNKGNSSEKIEEKHLPAGKYYIYVYGYEGAFDTTQCYNLEVKAATSTSKSLCSNNYEPNDSFDSAYAIRNILTYSSDISSPTDQDYYKIYIGGNSDLLVILENLPNDYDLKLYDNFKREIGSSANNGTTKEVINAKNLTGGIYYVHVYGKNGAYDPNKCYNLSVNFVPAEESTESSNIKNSIILYPNPVHDVINIKGSNILEKGSLTTFTILDRNGIIVKTLQTKVDDNISINVSDLPSNHYFLQILGQNYRFIKK